MVLCINLYWMRTATIKEMKAELGHYSHKQLMDTCLRLARFKKENKELITYLLFESEDEAGYVRQVKEEMDAQFEEINASSYYFIKKSCRKILRFVKKQIRYSQAKETEVELLLHFCRRMAELEPPLTGNQQLLNLFHRQLELARKKTTRLHEDLQYDFELEIQELLDESGLL